MIRIGIVGSDSSHAPAFSRLANLVNPETGMSLFDDVRVSCIWGAEKERTKEVAEQCEIPFVVDKPEDMLGKVDAVMVVLRDGGVHYRYASPFVRSGVATWVDKPFTISLTDTRKLIDEANKSGAILAGGSTCKYCTDVLVIKSEMERLKSESTVFSASFNFPGDINSTYGGEFFYGGHAIEMLTTMFGCEVKSFKVDVVEDTMIALVKYADCMVTINFSDVAEFYGTIYSLEKVFIHKIDISTVYKNGFMKFVEALKAGKMIEDFESLERPVVLLNKLVEAKNNGREVFI